MRCIKFRGKAKNGWVSGYFVVTGRVNKQNVLMPVCMITSGEHYWEVDCETVGQYTGIRDKNNMEIYEGDIVKFWICAGVLKVGYILYADDLAGFIVEGKLLRKWISSVEIEEVIGNIYDNPGLIKRGARR